MKLNKQILENRLRTKFSNLALYAIVNETYLNALVYDKKSLTKDQVNQLSIYSYKVLESLGGFSILENAMLEETDLNKIKLMGMIHQSCTEFATEATSTNLKEFKDEGKPIDEVIDTASFTKEEYAKFTNKTKDIDLKLISDLIKDKVVKVIKEEQEEYRQNEELEQELAEAIQPESDDMVEDEDRKDVSLDSYMDTFIGKSLPRKPISLFSKIQDITLENLLVSEKTEELDLNILLKVTLENVLSNKIINPIQSSMENIEFVCEALVNTNKDIDVASKASSMVTNTITIYTALETLYTLNLLKMDRNEVRAVLEQSVSIHDDAMEGLNSILLTMESDTTSLENLYRNDFAKKEILTSSINQVTTLSNKIATLESAGIGSDADKQLIQKMKERLNSSHKMLSYQLEQQHTPTDTVDIEPAYVKRDREFFIVELNKIARRISSTENPKDICIHHNPEVSEPKYLDVIVKDEVASKVSPTIVPIKYRPSFGSVLEYIKEAIDSSALSNMNGSISIYNVNTGRSEKIK